MLHALKKISYWIVTAAVVAFAAIVAVANRDTVTLSFDPLPLGATLPLYAVVFSSISIGLILGAAAGAGSMAVRARRKRRTQAPVPKAGQTPGTDLAA